MTWLAGTVVVASGLWLVGLAATIFVAPARAGRFLAGFASSARAHCTELALRMIAGLGFVLFGPRVWLSHAFAYDESVEWFGNAMKIAGRTSRLLAYLGYTLGRAGRRSEARGLLAQLDARSREGYVPPYFRALFHCGLGDVDRAFALLEEAAEMPDSMIRDLRVDPPLEILRPDPRYRKLLRRLRLD